MHRTTYVGRRLSCNILEAQAPFHATPNNSLRKSGGLLAGRQVGDQPRLTAFVFSRLASTSPAEFRTAQNRATTGTGLLRFDAFTAVAESLGSWNVTSKIVTQTVVTNFRAAKHGAEINIKTIAWLIPGLTVGRAYMQHPPEKGCDKNSQAKFKLPFGL
jgi:hypothetical protein